MSNFVNKCLSVHCLGPAGLLAGNDGIPGSWGQGGSYQETDYTMAGQLVERTRREAQAYQQAF